MRIMEGAFPESHALWLRYEANSLISEMVLVHRRTSSAYKRSAQ
jgi:hypothetical protein